MPNADSLYFTMLNCNKRSITVNMKTPQGKEVFVDLLKKCDIIMENFGPGVLDRFMHHTWPGNVRELRNLMERLAFLCARERVEADDLAFMLSPDSDSGCLPALDLRFPSPAFLRFFWCLVRVTCVHAVGQSSLAGSVGRLSSG